MSALQDGKGVVSSQVVQGFINVAARKVEVLFSVGDCLKYLDSVLAGLCRAALDEKERWG